MANLEIMTEIRTRSVGKSNTNDSEHLFNYM